MDINELSTNNLIKEDNNDHINTKQIINNLHNSKKNKTLISNVFIPTPDNIKIKFSEKNVNNLINLLTLSAALEGSDSSSTLKNSTSRPPSLPPCSVT